MSTSELATSYAALILADEDIDITVSISNLSTGSLRSAQLVGHLSADREP